MMRSPAVSAIIVFGDDARFIDEAISSVLTQTFDAWELLLVDRGATADCRRRVQGAVADRPDQLSVIDAAGHDMGSACNLGAGHARGGYLAFLDPADVWLPAKLEQQIRLLGSRPRLAMTFGRPQYWHSWSGAAEDQALDYTCESGVAAAGVVEPPLLFEQQVQNRYQTACLSDALMARDAFDRVGGFEQGLGDVNDIRGLFAKLQLTSRVFVAGERWTRIRQSRGGGRAVSENSANHGEWRQFLEWAQRHVAALPALDAAVGERIAGELDRHAVDGIRRALGVALPQLPLDEVVFLGEGLNHRAYRVNGEYVFRFPKHGAAEQSLEVEIRLLAYLEPRLALRVPSCRYIGNRSRWAGVRRWGGRRFPALLRRAGNRLRGFVRPQSAVELPMTDRLFVGYPEIHGSFLYPEFVDHAEIHARADLAAAIGQFLVQLHRTPVAAVRRLGVAEKRFAREYFAQRFALLREQIMPAFVSVGLDAVAARLASPLEQADFGAYRPSLVHGDLGWDHLVYDEDAQRLSGVIDFGGAFIGDPDYDFLEIKRCFGEEFVVEIAKAYGVTDPRPLLRKLALFEICSQVSLVRGSMIDGDAEAVARGLRRLRDLGGSAGAAE